MEDNVKPTNLNKVLEKLPKEDRETVVSAFYAMERTYSGPLPAPEDFALYEKTLQGSASKILQMTEKQMEHRIATETKIIEAKIRQSREGQIIGAVLVALFGIIALVLALTGHDTVAEWIGVTTVISIAIVFVLNKMPNSLGKKGNIE